jgi:hypothetical protein
VPAVVPVPKAVRVAFQGLIDGTKPWVNLFHLGWTVGGGLNLAEVTNLATGLGAMWATELAPNVSDTLQLLNTVVTALDSSSAPEAVVSTPSTGAQVNQSVAGGTAMVIQRKINRRYRGGHSRVYLPGMMASYLNDTEDEWNPVTSAVFAESWADIEQEGVTELIADGRTDAIGISISYFTGFTNVLYPSGRYHVRPNARVTPVVDNVVDYLANPRPCSQRRRQQA